ncbi:leucine-rich repeat domain, L domain-like protein [Artemisia annua]|uniref:Leucine-rich repeat domain, L domain-like protein n=1 Tax=Artemisia annua TaxID=35608 RepID=A0A2U1NM71_ARTAN|nr:leucine-rich repeat domain, L domain-like protein [Artemisia annua]
MDFGYKNKRTCIRSTQPLPDDVLCLIFKNIDTNIDQNSFGLSCRNFLDIQNSSRKCLKLGRPAWWSNCSSDTITRTLLSRFTQLEALSLGSCTHVSDLGLTPLLKYGSKLHSLYLDHCYRLTDVGFASVASGCKLLSVISLSRCTISDSGLEILTNSCISLREVNISGCTNITCAGILSLNRNCRQLRALNISGCEIFGVSFHGFSSTLTCLEAQKCAFYTTAVDGILSGGGLEYLNLSALCNRPSVLGANGLGLVPSNLKILNFAGCTFVDDDAIKKISKGCPLLQISYCHIGLFGWESIGLYCKNLEILHVIKCYYLCDTGLLSLGNGCKSLSVIYMIKNWPITTNGFESFIRMRKDVEIKCEVIRDIVPSWAFTSYDNNHMKKN